LLTIESAWHRVPYPHPERFFAAMQACVEQAKPLQKLARDILRGMGFDRPKLPKHPQDSYETIGAYRNAFAHDSVLGRAVCQGRDLLPQQHRLPKDGRLGNSITATDKLTSRIETFFTVLPDSMDAFRIWRRLVVEHEVRGAKVHDARLAAIMQAHGIQQILTFNTGDFKRFSHVVPVHLDRTGCLNGQFDAEAQLGQITGLIQSRLSRRPLHSPSGRP
jgi:hypothetical protein